MGMKSKGQKQGKVQQIEVLLGGSAQPIALETKLILLTALESVRGDRT